MPDGIGGKCKIELRNDTLVFYCENCTLYSDEILGRECISRQLRSLHLKHGLTLDVDTIQHVILTRERKRKLLGDFSVRAFKALYEIYTYKIKVKSPDLRFFIHDPLNVTLVNLAKKDKIVTEILKKYSLLEDFSSLLSSGFVFTDKVYTLFSQKSFGCKLEENFNSYLLEEYEVFPYVIRISEGFSGILYEVSLSPKLESIVPLMNMVHTQVREIVSDIFIREPFNVFIDESLSAVKRVLVKNVVGINTLNDFNLERLALLIVFQCLKMEQILPFLLDENVDELFINSPMDRIVIEHAKYGRCLSNVIAYPDLIKVLKLKCIIDSRKDLTEVNPSTRTELFSKFFVARVTIDVPPLAVNGPYIIFRKIKESLLPMYKLIELNMLNPRICALLVLSLYTRRNMAIVGEPKAGKTTLMNALRMLAPTWWRKIVIEETIESLGHLHDGSLLYKLYGGYSLSGDKFSESIKVLHRSPDIVFLGEVYTEEHSRAFFQLLSSGVQCICTFHARNPQSAISKWIYHHRIPREQIMNLDLIIHVSNVSLKNKPMRRVVSVGEASFSGKSSFKIFFTYVPSSDTFKQVTRIDDTRLARDLSAQYGFSPLDITSMLDEIELLIKSKVGLETFHKQILDILNRRRSHG